MKMIETWLRDEEAAIEADILAAGGQVQPEKASGGVVFEPASGYTSGRLARELAQKDMDEQGRKAWEAKQAAREAAVAAIKALVSDSGRTVEEKTRGLQEMKARGALDAVAGAYQSHLVLTEAIGKLTA